MRSKTIMILSIIMFIIGDNLNSQYIIHHDLTVTLAAAVTHIDTFFQYEYIVSNGSTSNQPLEVLRLEVGDRSSNAGGTLADFTAPAHWIGWTDKVVPVPKNPLARSIVIWDISDSIASIDDLYSPPVNALFPGASFNVSFKSMGLPHIMRFLARGWARPLTTIEYDSLRAIGMPRDEIIKPWYQDAFIGKTISPVIPPIPFNGFAYLDTLKSYINQSRSLDWITNDPTADKYTAFIDSARSNLQANNLGVTKANLDLVLQDVDADSGSTLSSEAYALLRFNTEYVLNKLREYEEELAGENQSSSWDATAANNARHLMKSGEYLHEVFISGGEVFYRRSDDEGSSWDQTHWINTAVGENSHPCITITQNGTVQIVWQRKIDSSVYEVWHSYGQDNGEAWSTPEILPEADGVEVSDYQSEGTTPVIAEIERTNILVLVYCSHEGLRYRISEEDGQSWQIPDPDIISGEYDDRVRFPSMAGGATYLSLVYDYADDAYSPWSRTFNGSSWSGENSIGKETAAGEGEYASVAIDVNDDPIAVWSGISPILQYGQVVTFRAGYRDNTWSDWFVEFGQQLVDLLNPSVTYYNREGEEYGAAIVHHTSQNFIKLIWLVSDGDPPEWDMSTLSESGAWANITQENSSSGMPFFCWTDQNDFPHEIVVETSGELSMASPLGVTQKRRAVVHHRDSEAVLSLDLEPMKIVDANGDTSVVPFKISSLRKRGKINLMNMWRYLGSDVISLPANVRQLIISKQFVQRGPSIAQRKFFLRALSPDSITIGVLDTTSVSGTVSVNIEPYAGRSVIFRPQLELIRITPPSVTVGVGDVFVVSDQQLKPPKGKKE